MNEEVNHLTISFLRVHFLTLLVIIFLRNKSAIKNNLWDKCRRIFLLIDIGALSFQFSYSFLFFIIIICTIIILESQPITLDYLNKLYCYFILCHVT